MQEHRSSSVHSASFPPFKPADGHRRRPRYCPMAARALVALLLLLLLLPGALCQPPYSCSDAATSALPFCNRRLGISQRVDDLLSRLSLEEKIAQLGNEAPAVARLGVPAYQWWTEALHGVCGYGRGFRFDGAIKGATSFPQVIVAAASFNPQLWYRIGQAIGTEARAMYNAGQATGMSLWTPNINIFRDPRWGRGQETPGEDPVTVAKYAASFVRGLQGESFQGGDLNVLQASACCKHFTAYDLDNWKGYSRFSFDARVTQQDLADTYQPPFKSCVSEGHASGIMCSYNSLNGVPTCADRSLLSGTARDSWGFNGYITSDCDSVSTIYESHGYAKTPEDAVADALQAGLDVNCGTYLQSHTGSAIQQKKVAEADINRALHNSFTVRMRLGLFDGNPQSLRFGDIGPNQVCSKEHLDLALEAALDGIVLLKNTANTLPLSKSAVRSLAVIGPNANDGFVLLGNYGGPACKYTGSLEAIKSYVKDTRYLSGCDTVACKSASIGDAVNLAKSVDQVILFMGLHMDLEKEELDRVDLVLPGMQQDLITSVSKAARKPVILVLICGGPVDVTFARDDPTIGAILWAGYPGENGAIAIRSVIFGEHNPGGRLPVTWYPQDFTKVPMNDMRMRPDPSSGYPGRTYRFYTGPTVFNFSHGLSYSSFAYRFTSVNARPFSLHNSAGPGAYDIEAIGTDVCETMRFSAVVRVRNHGQMAGRHSVLLFLQRSNAEVGSPAKELIAFESLHVDAGEETDVEFVVNPCEQLSRVRFDGSRVMDAGSHSLMVGEEAHEFTMIV